MIAFSIVQLKASLSFDEVSTYTFLGSISICFFFRNRLNLQNAIYDSKVTLKCRSTCISHNRAYSLAWEAK